MLWLVPFFFATALLYASVGFGGGSTYTALLALAALDYRLIAPLALICNILVVIGGTVRFARAGLVPWRRAGLLTALGAPAAFAGGLIAVEKHIFMGLLGASLMVSGFVLLATSPLVADEKDVEPLPAARMAPLLAAPLGFLAGIVGIGGGIFLAPVLHMLRWDRSRAVAATASLFILVNSLFGLAGQLLKGGEGRLALVVSHGLPLLLAVVIGGQIGSLLAARLMPANVIRWVTAALTLWVGARLLANLA